MKLLKWLIIFLYQIYTKKCEQTNIKPVGLPLNRDPDNPCPGYEPKKYGRGQFKFDDCEGDGHYLCKNCVHLQKENQNEHNDTI